MAFIADPVALINLVACIAIVIFSIWWYRAARSHIPLPIGAAFGLFGISYLAPLFDLTTRLKSFLIIIGVIAYLLVAFGLYLLATDIMRRRKAEMSLEDINTGLEQRVLERTAELADTNNRLTGEITERRRAEMALQNVNKKLHLLTGITRHDILNQLTALRNYLELSHGFVKDPAVVVFLKKEEQIAETIERQITFTGDYQELGAMAPAWQNVNTAVQDAVMRLPVRSVRVEVTHPDLEIFADPLLEKVFYNLIDNALRYGGEKMTMIRISSQESGQGLVIAVEDDGAGIAPEDKGRLFERGFGHHTGLGLFLSREIVGITGLTITETGEAGNGARFEITVPKGAWRFTGRI